MTTPEIRRESESVSNLSQHELQSKIQKNTRRAFWKEEEETILRDWADKAQCYEWMHDRSHKIYKSKNGWYTIPVIIISTITGTANFAQSRVPQSFVDSFVVIVGSLNILAGIITTIYQYLKISELNESHRVAQLSWGKFYRNVKTELAKHPLDRMGPAELLKISKEEFDRLLEISPPIPDKVVNDFKRHFKNTTDLTKPEICDVIMPTIVFPMSSEERQHIMELMETKQEDAAIVMIDPKLEEFKSMFFELNGRQPTTQELNDNYYKVFDEAQVESNPMRMSSTIDLDLEMGEGSRQTSI